MFYHREELYVDAEQKRIKAPENIEHRNIVACIYECKLSSSYRRKEKVLLHTSQQIFFSRWIYDRIRSFELNV